MPFPKLERHLKEQAKEREKAAAIAAEQEARLTLERTVKETVKEILPSSEQKNRLELKRAVKEILPARLVKPPERKKGRSPTGGVSKKEVAELRKRASSYLNGEGGMQEFEAAVQHTALVILLIDGVLGTEPWRAAHHAHGGLIAANARLRYLENAARLLDDLRRSRKSGSGPALLEGVIDAEPVAR